MMLADKYKGMLSVLLCLIGMTLFGQEKDIRQEPTSISQQDVVEEPAGAAYMAERLFFQVKKRMNLTTKEEEREEELEAKKKVRFRILGITVERN